MKNTTGKLIYTIGHSTRSLEELVAMLRSFHVAVLADIRRYPGSRHLPQFNKDALKTSLPAHDIQYIHIEALGGRRKVAPDSKNDAWRLAAFRGYADYMETDAFKEAISMLEDIAATQRTAYMCSEAVWWSCHRALVSDYLKSRGWMVLHIMGVGKQEEHPYTSAASIVNGTLSYGKGDQMLF